MRSSTTSVAIALCLAALTGCSSSSSSSSSAPTHRAESARAARADLVGRAMHRWVVGIAMR
jgi:hypothetical protein